MNKNVERVIGFTAFTGGAGGIGDSVRRAYCAGIHEASGEDVGWFDSMHVAQIESVVGVVLMLIGYRALMLNIRKAVS